MRLRQPLTGAEHLVQVKSRSGRKLSEEDVRLIIDDFRAIAAGRSCALFTNTRLSAGARAAALQHKLTVYDCHVVAEWVTTHQCALAKRASVKTMLGEDVAPTRRYKKKVWDADEENVFVEAFHAMGLGASDDKKKPWASLLDKIETDSPGILRERTATNLKDKARSLGLLM